MCEGADIQHFLFERLVNGMRGEFASIGSITLVYH
jgi:hypothetical protein